MTPFRRTADPAGRPPVPPGFTLIEVAVALVILGILAATVYLALDGTLRSADRIQQGQEPWQQARVARSFLVSALRSAAPFAGVPGDGFVAVDSTWSGEPRDELTFVAFSPGSAGGGRMQVRLFVADTAGTPALLVEVRELDATGDSLPAFQRHLLSRGVAGLDIGYLSVPASADTEWEEDWPSRIRLPHAVRVTFLPGEVSDPAYDTPIVVQIPAGRLL